MVVPIEFFLNGEPRRAEVEPHETLLDLVREHCGLTGAKLACNLQVCGACTVLLDGAAVSACSVLALDARGKHVTTVEGLARPGLLSPLQQAFVDHGAFQCGFCTSGMLMMATALLAEHPYPTEAQVRTYMQGNICRCTGYKPIVEAILAVRET